jgi:predicted transcriptional regulator
LLPLDHVLKSLYAILMETTQTELARKWGKSQGYIADLKKGRRFTTEVDLAKDMAEKYGKSPLAYINKKHRKVYLKAYPELIETVAV